MEIGGLFEESQANEAKRARFAAAVSLDDAIDFEPLEGLTVVLLTKISGLTDEEELEGKRKVLEMMAHIVSTRSSRRARPTA
jgi:hypothetical protein